MSNTVINRRKKKRKPAYLSFIIGKEIYSVQAVKVLEVLKKPEITYIPGALDFVIGVVSFRGNIVPVIDMCQKLNMKSCKYPNEYVVIVFEDIYMDDKSYIGVVAVDVKDVLTADNQQILPVPETSLQYDAKYLTGMIKCNNEFVLILDIEKVLK